MITYKEIHKRAIKKFPSYLINKLEGNPFEKIIVAGRQKITGNFLQEVTQLNIDSKQNKDFGYEVEYEERKMKNYGLQSAPCLIFFSTEIDYLKFIKKEKEVKV